MEGFYAAIMVAGLIFIIISLIVILIDKKNFKKDIELVTENTLALREVVADAEYLIEELSRLSDSVSDQINNKKNELDKHLSNIAAQLDQQIDQFEKKTLKLNKKEDNRRRSKKISIRMNTSKVENGKAENGHKKYKMSDKYKKVAELLKNGVDEAEVARILDISRGEVQMVSRFMEKVEA